MEIIHTNMSIIQVLNGAQHNYMSVPKGNSDNFAEISGNQFVIQYHYLDVSSFVAYSHIVTYDDLYRFS